jgi:Golgi phosphoprotein 3
MDHQLPLHEEVMLLALRDEKGSIDSKAQFYPQIIAGAIISELLLTGFIKVSNDKKQLVEVANESLTGNQLLEEALYRISSKDKPKELKHWLSSLSAIPKLKNKIAQSLCEKGILDEVDVKILWMFSLKRFPELNPSYEKQLIERLRNAIFSDEWIVDARTATLIALLKKSTILNIPFEPKEIKTQKDRIESISTGEMVSDATAEVIQTIQSVIIITAVMPAIIVAVTGRDYALVSF